MNPPSRNSPPGSPERWLEYSESDLNLAKLAHGRADVRPELVGFHAQQAVEKAFKAVLLKAQVEFPFVHDIEELLEIAGENGIAVPPEFEGAGALTPFAAALRYPSDAESVDAQDIAAALALAERVIHWARTVVNP